MTNMSCCQRRKMRWLMLFTAESSITSRVNSGHAASHAQSLTPPPSSEKDVQEQQQGIDFFLRCIFICVVNGFSLLIFVQKN